MDNLARKFEGRGEVLGMMGEVRERGHAGITVQTEGGPLVARRAASCLLDPQVGDLVLVASADRGSFILSVLERDAARSTEISVEGDLRLRAARGTVAVVAQEGIDLISAGPTKIVSNGVDVRSTRLGLVVDGLELVGSWVTAEVERAKVVAQSVDHFLDRFSQRVRRSYRRVEDIDQLQAGSVHHKVEQTLRVHAKDTAITADGIVKIDGEQIHVG